MASPAPTSAPAPVPQVIKLGELIACLNPTLKMVDVVAPSGMSRSVAEQVRAHTKPKRTPDRVSPLPASIAVMQAFSPPPEPPLQLPCQARCAFPKTNTAHPFPYRPLPLPMRPHSPPATHSPSNTRPHSLACHLPTGFGVPPYNLVTPPSSLITPPL
eukprot:scaffold2561_cov108-Isochrysis_galbana.AAC.3